jgi:complement component 1 Q subcomponent-binding protein
VQIEDTQGHDEVTLSRKFGGESIRLVFSIADLSTGQEEPFEQEENDEEASEDDAPMNVYPIRCSFSITKVRRSPSAQGMLADVVA